MRSAGAAAGCAARLLVVLAVCLASPAGRAMQDLHVVALFKDRVVVVIDGVRHLLRAGETSPEGVRVVSADSAGAVFEYQGRTLERRLDGRSPEHPCPVSRCSRRSSAIRCASRV